MLDFVIIAAGWIHRRRLLLGVAAGAGVVLLLTSLRDGSGGATGLAGLVLLVWASFLFATAHFFAGRDWQAPRPDAGLLVRLRWRVELLGAWLAVLGLGVLAGLLVLFTLRAMTAI